MQWSISYTGNSGCKRVMVLLPVAIEVRYIVYIPFSKQALIAVVETNKSCYCIMKFIHLRVCHPLALMGGRLFSSV